MARHTVLIEQHHPPPELKGNGTWIWRPRAFANFDYAVSYAKQQITDADLNWGCTASVYEENKARRRKLRARFWKDSHGSLKSKLF